MIRSMEEKHWVHATTLYLVVCPACACLGYYWMAQV